MSDTPIICLITILIVFTIFAWPTLDHEARDARMLQVISLDEAGFLNVVQNLHETGDLSIGHFTYPALYPYLALIIAKGQGLFGAITDAAIIKSLRLICLAAALLTLLLAYRIGASAFDRETGVTAVALLASVPVFFRWSVEAHPDLPQLAFLTAGVYALSRAAKLETLGDLIASSLFAGLAFGTKYGGFLLVPAIGFVIFRVATDSRTKLQAGLACLLVFAAAFTLTNPYVIGNWDRFTADLSFVGRIVSDEPDVSPLAWFGILFSPAIGLFIGVLLALTCVFSLTGKGPLARREDHLVLIVFAATCLVFLLIRIRFIQGQYLLPVLPVFAVVAASVLPSRCRAWGLPASGRIAVVLAVAVVQASFSRDAWSARVRDLTEDPIIASGLWLEEAYGSNTTILFDAYAYVPSKFTRAQSVFGPSYSLIHLLAPDLLLTRSSIRDRYRSPDTPTDFRLTDDAAEAADFLYLQNQRYRDIHDTYSYLENGVIPEYSLVRDFGDVTLYARRERVDAARWDRIQHAHTTGTLPAVAAAGSFMSFGTLHATAGNYPQASIQYRKAVEALPDNAMAKDHLAASLAHQDSVEVAWSLWEEAETHSNDTASIWIRAGWALYASGHYEASRNASQRAIESAPEHPYPRFNIALAHLAEGNVTAADSVYSAALENHELPEATANILAELKQNEGLSLEGIALVNRLLVERGSSGRTQSDHPE